MIFVLECAVCTVLFGILTLRLHYIKKKDDTAQRKSCKPFGFFLLLPSLGLIASAVGFIFRPEIDVHIYAAYTLIGLSAALVVWLVFKIIIQRKNKSITARFIRFISVAAISSPLSLMVGMILSIVEVEDDAASLVCLSAATFGAVALLIAINLILVTYCEYQSTKNSLKTINNFIKSKRLAIVRISVAKDIFLVVCKSVLSIVAKSFFMFANALYSAGLGVARFIAVRMHTQSGEEQINSYSHVGSVIFLASTCYVIYSIRLFFKSSTASFPQIVGIAIACYTFFEFFINIRETVKLRKSKALEAKALRAISLSSTLLCFVLTQTALMSLDPETDPSHANAIAGICFGSGAALVGVYVMVRSKLLSRRKIHEQDTRTTRKNGKTD